MRAVAPRTPRTMEIDGAPVIGPQAGDVLVCRASVGIPDSELAPSTVRSVVNES
jgi:hypothetical protein